MKKFDFTFLDNARETYDDRGTPQTHQTLEDQDQESTQYYCGLCKGWQSLSAPCPHHPGAEV